MTEKKKNNMKTQRRKAMAAVSVMRNIKKVERGRAEDERRKTKSKTRKNYRKQPSERVGGLNFEL